MKNIIFLQLNEVNFDLVKNYVNRGELKNFSKLLNNYHYYTTNSEEKYEYLEPWIQWYSFYMGKKFDQHKVFYLNEGSNTDISFFEILNKKFKKKIAFFFPMNLKNNFDENCLFIPDPWTQTKVNAGKLLNKFYESVSNIVKNKRNLFKVKNLFYLILSFLILTNFRSKFQLSKLFLSLITKKYFRAIFLDYFIFLVFKDMKIGKNFDISCIFLNACAHLQHHYFFASMNEKNKFALPNWYLKKGHDPILDCLKIYDQMIGYLFDADKNIKFIIATGLSQKLIEKPIYYWSLKKPNSFFKEIGIYPTKIIKRMSRDYTLEFENSSQANINKDLLINFSNLNNKFFNINIKNNKVFLEINYTENFDKDKFITDGNKNFYLKNILSFVAIKNSIHSDLGYVYSNFEITKKTNFNISEFFKLFMEKFNVN